MSLLRTISFVLAACVGWASAVHAQETPKDDADSVPAQKSDESRNREGLAEPQTKTSEPQTKSAPKQDGELAPKDKALDSLLEKLGETDEHPTTEGRPKVPGPEATPPGPAQPGQPKGGDLTGKAKDLDEHLEELTGRKRKKKPGEEDGQGSGPLSDIIKEMRDVEKRLGKPDTGEETREKQKQIVKKLDTIIEQLRNSSSQGRMTVIREVRQPGQKPGGQKGGPGATGNSGRGVSASKPAKPQPKSILAVDKNAWGHLPEELRGEMENVFNEQPLQDRAELIRRYYLSVSKKGQSRSE